MRGLPVPFFPFFHLIAAPHCLTDTAFESQGTFGPLMKVSLASVLALQISHSGSQHVMTTLDCKHEQLRKAVLAWSHFASTVETHREELVCPAGTRERFPDEVVPMVSQSTGISVPLRDAR